MLGIIGGHGLFKLDGMTNIDARLITTPFGAPSAAVAVGKMFGQNIAFLPRLGLSDDLMPSEVNDRANLWALKEAGVRAVVSIAPIVSLGIDLEVGDLALMNQIFDSTRGQRPSTFFGGGLAGHISVTEPVCGALNDKLSKTATSHGVKIRPGKTLAAIDGPRFSTLKERQFFESAGCHLIGMHHVPEIFLAREVRLCYAAIGIVTGSEKVTAVTAREAGIAAQERIQFLLKKLILNPVPLAACSCGSALGAAVLADESLIYGDAKQKLLFLKNS